MATNILPQNAPNGGTTPRLRTITLTLTNDEMRAIAHVSLEVALKIVEALRADLISKGIPVEVLEAIDSRRSPIPSPAPEMTLLEALDIGEQAARHVLEGAPVLSTFDPAKVREALGLLREFIYDVLDGALQGQRLRSLFVAVGQVQRGLEFDRHVGRARGPQKPALIAALEILPQVREELQAGPDDRRYWRKFAFEAFAEVKDIFKGVEL